MMEVAFSVCVRCRRVGLPLRVYREAESPSPAIEAQNVDHMCGIIYCQQTLRAKSHSQSHCISSSRWSFSIMPVCPLAKSVEAGSNGLCAFVSSLSGP